MLRLLVVNTPRNRDLEDTAKLYIDALSLPMEIHVADDYPTAIAQLETAGNFDLFFGPVPENNSIPEKLAQTPAFQGGLKALFLSDASSQPLHFAYPHSVLSHPLPISDFFAALCKMLPEVAAQAPFQKEPRWLLGHDMLLLLISSVLKIIREKYRQDISLTELAAQVYVSPCYLSTTFSKFIGVSPMAYVNQLRMEEAVILLTTTSTSVTEICSQVGYSNLPYFCTSFKKKYGMTPSEFRQQNTSL